MYSRKRLYLFERDPDIQYFQLAEQRVMINCLVCRSYKLINLRVLRPISMLRMMIRIYILFKHPLYKCIY